MATTPEEFFVKGLMEPLPPSPPVFLDLPQEPNHRSSEDRHHVLNNDMILPYISHVLMDDDDIDDTLTDYQALLQVQQPFVQILSSSSIGNNTDNDLLKDCGGDESALNLPLSRGAEAASAFLKSMEEANMLLPKDNSITSDKQVNRMVRESNSRKKRNNRDDNQEEVGQTCKSLKEPAENSANENEVVDELMLNGYEICTRNMEKMRVSMDNELEKEIKKSGKKAVKDATVDICAMLISCAEHVAANNHMRAGEMLNRIKRHASATGDARQRLAECFTKGLEARLVGAGSLRWQLLIAQRPSVMEFLAAINLYFVACCFNRVAFFFTIMTVMKAMVGKSRLHIVDYGMRYGFQWAHLLRLLASREGVLPEVKITAIGRPNLKAWPTEETGKTGCRLSKCAHEFGLPSFKFHTIMKQWEDVCIRDLNIDANEVLVVNDLFSFSTLVDESIYFERPNPRDTVLGNIKRMKPDVFIQSIFNYSYGPSFLPRFREALFFFMALFDTFDASIPRQNKYRLLLEQVVLGRSALNLIACEGLDLVERPEKYRQWQKRNQRAGLRQSPLKSGIVEEVKDQVMKHHHKDFFISEEGQWLLQGWMGRVLFAHSTWVAEDASSDAE